MNLPQLITILAMIPIISLAGLLAAWGYLMPYLASYQRLFDRGLTLADINSIQYTVISSEILTILVFDKFLKKTGYKLGIQLATLCFGISMMIGSYCTALNEFYIIFGLLGFSSSTLGLLMFLMLADKMPNNTGIASFCAGIGFTFSLPIYAEAIQKIINPDDLLPKIIAKEGEISVNYYGITVAKNLPNFFWIFGVIAISIGLTLPQLIHEKKQEISSQKSRENTDKKEPKTPKISRIPKINSGKFHHKELSTFRFWILFLSCQYLLALCYFFRSYFKQICQEHHSDQAAMNFSRFMLFGQLGFKQLASVIYDKLHIVNSAVFSFALFLTGTLLLHNYSNRINMFYLGFLCINLLYEKICCVLYCSSQKLYGKKTGHKIFKVLGLASPSSFLVVMFFDRMLRLVGWEWVFIWIYCSGGVLAVLFYRSFVGFCKRDWLREMKAEVRSEINSELVSKSEMKKKPSYLFYTNCYSEKKKR